MWLGSDLIGVVLPSEIPSIKPDKIPMSGDIEIKPNTTNMEKGLIYRYILPWTTLERPKMTIGC